MNRRNFLALAPAFPAAAVTATVTLKREGEPAIDGLGVSVLKCQPGDYVVLSVDASLSFETAERIRAMWEHSVPGTKAIVLSDGMKLHGVMRGIHAYY